jgi:dTDP-glucose 4,6-dehydratase
MDIVTQILGLLDKPESLIQFVEDRPGHDRRYAMDSSKLRDELGWAPALRFEDGLKATVQWYLDSGTWLEHVRSGAYQGYYEMLYGERGPAA